MTSRPCIVRNPQLQHTCAFRIVWCACVATLDVLATHGILNLSHLVLVPTAGNASNKHLMDVYRKRVAFYLLSEVEQRKLLDEYACSMACQDDGWRGVRLPRRLPLGPLRDALRGGGPVGWRCDHGALPSHVSDERWLCVCLRRWGGILMVRFEEVVVYAAHVAVEAVKQVPSLVRWSSFGPVLARGRAERQRFGAITVCRSGTDNVHVPAGHLRRFGPVGLDFPTQHPTLVRLCIGSTESTTRPDGQAWRTVQIQLPKRCITLKSLATLNVVGVSTGADCLKVDVRHLQLARDAGEMLVCHAFTHPRCTCQRAVNRVPEVHTSTAQLLRHMGYLERPTPLPVLVMLYVTAMTEAMLLRMAKRAPAVRHHHSIALAVQLADQLCQAALERWGAGNSACHTAFYSSMAALPRVLLGEVEPFRRMIWEDASDAARHRQGKPKRQQVWFMCVLPSLCWRCMEKVQLWGCVHAGTSVSCMRLLVHYLVMCTYLL